ncbi:MAG: class II aldolase/adducin family protein [Planctomycetota bacterium]|jgi:rhamnose utilization protein RhaD (predicted bifunctional aldolase and dehydrogenase)
MKTELENFFRISKRLGKDKSLVLGSFGNTSVKTDDGRYMMIKASGTRLKDMTSHAGWRQLRIQQVLDLLDDEALKALDSDHNHTVNDALLKTCCDDKPAKVRPSIESFFHAILDRCVIHLHPAAVLSVACAKDGHHHLVGLFAHKKNKPLWIPYVGLGFTCAKEIAHHVSMYKKEHRRSPSILVVQNHGLIISEKDPDAAAHRVEKTMKVFEKVMVPLKGKPAKESDPEEMLHIAHTIRMAIHEATDQRINTAHLNNKTIAGFMNLPNAESLCLGGPITNDEAAFTHGPPVLLADAAPETISRAIKDRLDAGFKAPAAYLIRPHGLFVAKPDNHMDEVTDVCMAYMRIRTAAATMGGARPIPKTLLDQYAEPTA